MKLFSSKRRLAVAAAIVLGLFLLRPGASHLKSRIVSSISSAVGRSVDVGSVHMRLLPRPGFDLENLVVYDAPAFGAEPMLRAGGVTASLRLSSLLRGRLEIARLELTEPSLNLVHTPGGRWNLEALLERTAHNPLAPTGKAKSEPRPGFPYIEATSARINFKSGPEKKPYALTNADFSLWQDSENSWGVRLKAQPFRTDLNLNDTGLLQVSGTWQRADTLRDTPLQFTIQWSRAQLGQFTKFFTGNDQGWRGQVLLNVALAGTPADLQIASNASIQDFRRYDITSGNALRLAGHCDAGYSSVDHAFHGLLCSAPVGTGLITLKGNMGLLGSRNYELAVMAQNVPASAAVALAQRAKNNLPEDLVASGSVGGSLRIEQKPAANLRLEGHGAFSDFHLASVANKTEIGPETVPFVISVGDSSASVGSRRIAFRKNATGMRIPDEPYVEFGPFPVAIGGATPATAQGWINRGGYNLTIAGEAEISKALRLGRMSGLPALQSTAEGTAEVDLHIAGSWAERSHGTNSGFTGPQVTGSAKLRNARVALRGVGEPIAVAAADVQFLHDVVRVSKLNAKAGETRWTGSLEMPRGCGTPEACEVHFALSANQIALAEFGEWVSPSTKQRPWYRILESSATAGPSETSFLTIARASGQITADRLLLQGLPATRVSAKVRLASGKLQISELNADFLGGKHRGHWQADFKAKPIVCNGSGTLTGASLAELAGATKNDWIAGTVNASYEMNGPCTPEFWGTAEGSLQFDMKDGALPGGSWEASPRETAETLRVAEFAGQAQLHAGMIEIKDGKLDSPGGKFQVSGTASLKGELDLRMAGTPNAGAAAGYTITGTLAEPRVIRLAGPETQARLKPDAAK
ncbi:MAG TPA: AsmA family protein [Candidatus Sulfotelmatobacter sp.]